MAFSHEFVPHPTSRGNLIERRICSVPGAVLDQMKLVVPFGKTASVWWQMDVSKATQLLIGTPTKPNDKRIVKPLMGNDRAFIEGDAPDTLFECRRFVNNASKTEMLKVRPAGQVPGMECMAWWEKDYPEGYEGPWVLEIGLKASKNAPVAVPKSDGDRLENKSKAELLTIAGREGIREPLKDSPEGEIVAKILGNREAKKNAANKPQTVGAA